MKQMILVSDAYGRSLRGVAPATAAETVMISPDDRPMPHTRCVTLPEDWRPNFGGGMAAGKRQWWVCDRIFAAAVQQLNLDADFFWCVESDVAAEPDVWKRLMAAGEKRALDGVFVHLSTRADNPGNPWLAHETSPPWTTHHCLGAVYRFSRRALDWMAQSAPDNRNVFCEVNAPSLIRREGGSIGDLHQLGWFYNRQTMRPPPRCMINSMLLNHPLKTNTVGPEIVR